MSGEGDFAWMKSLKEGDEAFMEVTTFGSSWIKPVVISRITKTMVILKSGTRFRFDGNEVGSCHSGKIRQNTEENRERYWIQEQRKELAAVIADLYGIPTIIADLYGIPTNRIYLNREKLERMIPALKAVRDELKGVKS